MLVRGGRIIAVGPRESTRALAGSSVRVRNLEGATVTAGFVDAHVHLTTWALGRQQVVLAGSATLEEAVRRVAAVGPDPRGWTLGHGWNRHAWPRLPTSADLDALVADRPVFLDSQDLHAAWLNNEALRRCGIEAGTPDPPGGRIVRDEVTGEPTGLLLEGARAMARERIPRPPETQIQQALEEAQREAHRLGLTGVHSVEATGLRDFAKLEGRSCLTLRVLQHIQLHHLSGAVEVGIRSGFGSDHLRIGGVKMFLDGSLGSRTAWLREPYLGNLDERGIQTLEEGDFIEAVQSAAGSGLATTVHAIGDAAVALAIRVLKAIEPPASLPHRIEHLQLCPPDLRRMLAGSGIVASMQPAHLLTDLDAADRHWGHERSEGAYAFGALARDGVVLAFGSDVPVETLDPRPGLFAATRRLDWSAYLEGGSARDEWHAGQRLSGPQAVVAYTTGAAEAEGLALRRGRLEPGFDADFSVWSLDPVTSSPEEYRSMECLMTVVDGRIVYGEEAG